MTKEFDIVKAFLTGISKISSSKYLLRQTFLWLKVVPLIRNSNLRCFLIFGNNCGQNRVKIFKPYHHQKSLDRYFWYLLQTCFKLMRKGHLYLFAEKKFCPPISLTEQNEAKFQFFSFFHFVVKKKHLIKP